MNRQKSSEERDWPEEVAGEEASQSSLEELSPDAGEQTTQPGRGTVSGSEEPSPTGQVGVSDFPVADEGTQSR